MQPNSLRFIFITISLALIGSSCLSPEQNKVRRSTSSVKGGGALGDNGLNGSDVDGNGATKGNGGLSGEADDENPDVEIRHLIEPKVDADDVGGTYTRKLTLPKNYDRLLYLAGINVGTLVDKNVKVRFKFGLTSEPITVNATVSTASGLTPQTSVQVLVMDLRNKPFDNVQLIYDLFDYNDYSFLGSTAAGALSEPVMDNRNQKLFCRGLQLGDDPTFGGDVSGGCNSATQVCKYAYAKIVDKGLIKQGAPNVPLTPNKMNIQSSSTSNYDADSDTIKISRCLPNNPALSGGLYKYVYKYNADNANPPDEMSFIAATGIGSTVAVNAVNYAFEGPYRAVNLANWQITSSAIWNASAGIFGESMYGASASYGINSRLFPLYTKMDLSTGVQYVGSTNPGDTKTLMSMSSNTKSAWMDGCNERVSTVQPVTGEHIGSCSVTATVEIITVDDSGVETLIDITNEVKLQLVKPAVINADGENVLLSSFNACDSSSQCGAEECCFNGRCWDNSLVTQCIEDAPTFGNGVPGQTCQTDFDCAGLCCDPSKGKCAVHDTIQEPPVYCSKPSGSFCIAKEWCMQHTITECFIVKTGLDNLGNSTCALRCYTSKQFGDCKSGLCVPPVQPTQPVFNESDPNRCDSAIDPPSYSDTGVN